jgi:hypothetical protein
MTTKEHSPGQQIPKEIKDGATSNSSDDPDQHGSVGGVRANDARLPKSSAREPGYGNGEGVRPPNSVRLNIPWTPSTDDFDEIWDDGSGTTSDLSVPDILCTMFAQQFRHMANYAEINPAANIQTHERGNIDTPRVQAAIREFAGYTVEELYEAINHLKNKPWKQTHVETDREAFVEELADVWHFFIELHLIAGVEPLEVFTSYFRKAFINAQRQHVGY